MGFRLSRLILLVMLASALFSANVQSAPSTIRIKVGVSTSLTGETSAMGLDISEALQFSNDYFFRGRYELELQDDKCDKATAITVAKKLTDVDRVQYVLGLLCNGALLAAAPVYNRAGTVVITAGATSGDQARIGAKIFRPYPADHLAVEPIARYVITKHKRLGIITQIDEYAALMERSLLARLQGSAVKAIVEQTVPTNTDFRPLLLRLKQENIDGLFLNAMAEPGYIEMVKQTKQLGLTWQLYANLLPSSDVVRSSLGTLDESVIFSDLPIEVASLSPEKKKIWDAFTAKYGARRSSIAINMLAIDSLRMLDEAIASGEPVADYLKKIRFEGLFGSISFDANGAVTGIDYSLRKLSAGTLSPIIP